MNRGEFLTKFFNMYPNSFNDRNIGDWTDAYMLVLSDRLDFDKIFHFMVRNYNETYKAPSPSWFKSYIEDCKLKEHNKLKQEPAILFDNAGIPDHVKAKMQELKRKLKVVK